MYVSLQIRATFKSLTPKKQASLAGRLTTLG